MTPKLARLEELALKAKDHIETHTTVLSMRFGKEYANAASPHVMLDLINKLKVAREALEYIAKTSEEHGPRDTVDIMSDLANQRLFDIDKARKALEEIDQ